MKLTPDYLFKRRGHYGQFPSLAEMVDATGICWEWLGYLSKKGYGQVYVNGKLTKAHRAFYEILVGEIPGGLQIDHLCRNRKCVNPDHLEPVTPGENTRRGVNTQRGKTHCPQGHLYDEKNTYSYYYLNKNAKGRNCRACHCDRERLVRANKKLVA